MWNEPDKCPPRFLKSITEIPFNLSASLLADLPRSKPRIDGANSHRHYLKLF